LQEVDVAKPKVSTRKKTTPKKASTISDLSPKPATTRMVSAGARRRYIT
jgi:hypothetical protein